jgi:hypothetical protein
MNSQAMIEGGHDNAIRREGKYMSKC